MRFLKRNKWIITLSLITFAIALIAVMTHQKIPSAAKIPKILEKHGDTRIDNYYWMNQRDSPEVLAYLKEENAYYEAMTAPLKIFKERLFQEMKGRIKEDDATVPYRYRGYWYQTKYEKGKDYPIHVRRRDLAGAAEEVLFDCNEMAKGLSFFNLGSFAVSPDNRYAAYTTDTLSRRIYTLRIKDLETGELLPQSIENTEPEIVWASDADTFFYVRKDSVTLRSFQVFRNSLTNPKEELVFEEKDDTFHVTISGTKSEKYLVISSYSTLSTESRILEADNPKGAFRVFQPRHEKLEYSIEHFDNYFYILTNADGASNFKMMRTPEGQTEKKYWEEFIPHEKKTLLEGFDVFKDYLVVSERTNGLSQIKIIPWKKPQEAYYLPFDNETYTASTTSNVEMDTPVLRYIYSAMTTPSSVIDFNMETKTQEVKKEAEVLGGNFDKSNYRSERLWAPAKDGTKIPISMVYRKGFRKDGSRPLLLYGYGAYGNTIDPSFSATRLSLLDRGFAFAIAHVRGGEYMGREWYEGGKLLNKENTFTDFIDCTKCLIENKYTSPKHCYATGASAGGLLMGAVANMAPQLYNGIVADVPFVDVVTTMLDESIPLTTGEYDEWGDPNIKKYYSYMKHYSPYDNVEAKEYPNMLILTGYHDSQVQYWEPAKWVAKLRENKTDDHVLLFFINMDVGHGGPSGRFEALKEVAEEYAFLLSMEDFSN